MRMFAPTTLQKALSLARLQESTIESNNKRNRNIRPNSSYSLALLPTPKGSSTSVLPQGPSLSPVLPPGPSLPSKPPEATLNRSWPQKSPKTLPNNEMDEKKAKGLCFWCEKRYVPGHQYKRKQLYRIEVMAK